jgi:single-strand DNA-binding protein
MSHQKCEIIGHLGTEPEMRYSPSGQPVTNFSVAANRKYKNAAGQTVKETTWFKVSAWGKLAEACNSYLHKGSLVYVEGRLVADPSSGSPRIWNRQDGTPAASFDLHADTVDFLDSKNSEGNGNGASTEGANSGEGEIPF